jgi:hypothetical protein
MKNNSRSAMKTKQATTMVAVDQPRLVLLGRGRGRTHAEEIKSLGLKVGDTIRGKESGDIPGRSWWHEVRLTVLWVGEKQVIYRKQWRANHHPDGWHDDGEVANFTLTCREYYLEGSREDVAGASLGTDSQSSEVVRLRSIFPKILEALQSGACSSDCSVEFMEMIPNEVAMVLKKIKRERDLYKAWARKFRDLLAPLAWLDGVDNPNNTEKAIVEFDAQDSEVSKRQR